MIITKESEIFQKLLKDVEYIKSALTFSGKYYIGCDPIEQKNLPTFKIGDWVIRTVGKDDNHHAFGRIFKIATLYGGQIDDADKYTHFSSSLRHATKDEIKNHLIEEAIKRGLVGYRKFKWDDPIGENEISTILPNHGFEYLPDHDALTIGIAERESRRSIYLNGRWATPIFEEKIINESTLFNLLKDFTTRLYASDYLSDRDDEIYKFLISKGYFK